MLNRFATQILAGLGLALAGAGGALAQPRSAADPVGESIPETAGGKQGWPVR